MPRLQIKRGTRAQLNTARTASGLFVGEPYLITDEDAVAVGKATNAYIDLASRSHLIPLTLTIPGTLVVGAGVVRWYAQRTYTIGNIHAAVGTAPTGASLIADVNKNGTTIFTTQGNRPTIAASGFTDATSAPDVTTLASGDYLTVDVDQIGSTIAGANLTIQIALS